MSVYIFMPTRNNLTWLKESIKTLRWYTDLDKNKLHVFNSACSDGTQEFLHTEGIDTFDSMTNISGDKCFNIMLEKFMKETKLKYFCYVHDDMLFTKDWLKIMLEEIENIKDCYLLGCANVLHSKAYMIPDERRNLIAEKLKENFTGRAGPPMFLLKRECAEKVGFIDEGFSFGECSDNDYFKRIEESGHKFMLTHKAVIFHAEKTTRANIEGHAEYVRKSLEYFSKKHNGEDRSKWGFNWRPLVSADGEFWKVWGAK